MGRRTICGMRVRVWKWLAVAPAVGDAARMDASVPPLHPTWFGALLVDLERAFAVTGSATPGWDDPDPDRDPPPEKYSHCSDPGKYAIIHARVAAWVQVLAARSMATATGVAPQPWLDALRSPELLARTLCLQPRVPGGITLVLASTVVDGQVFGLDVGLSKQGRTVVVDSVPDCGCDACDSGSADLLQTVDGWVLTAARGGVLHARRGASTITRTVDGWKGTGDSLDESWLDGSLPSPHGVERWAGSAWK